MTAPADCEPLWLDTETDWTPAPSTPASTTYADKDATDSRSPKNGYAPSAT